jgi:hypothetical protein
MNRTFIRLVFLGPLAATLVVHAADVRVGVAATDISPPLGAPLAGYYHERGADGVLDPLYSKAMAIESEGQRAVFVVLDLLTINRVVTDQARALMEKATGLEGGRVMISATHAHTGPQLVSRAGRSGDLSDQTRIAVEYTEALPAKIAESVRLALEHLQPARLSFAVGRCDDLSFNRRYFMRDGSVGWNPGKLNPKIVLPAGLTDPQVGVLYAEKSDAVGPAQAIVTYVNFAMHPDTTGGSKISADWPGALSRVLAAYHGTNHQTVTANGTCGNLNHVDVSWKSPQSGPGEANRIGIILGAAVFRTYKDLQPCTGGLIRVEREIVELGLPEVTPAQVAEAKAILETTHDDSGANFMKLVRAQRTLDVARREGQPHHVEVQAIALGNEVAWVGLPGEIFVELGLAIKKSSPFRQTFVVELANESLGYIPDRRSYSEGNYEPESARCAPGSGEKLVEAANKLLTQLHTSNGHESTRMGLGLER